MLNFKAQNLSNISQNNTIIKNSKYLVAVMGRKLISYESIGDHPGEITLKKIHFLEVETTLKYLLKVLQNVLKGTGLFVKQFWQNLFKMNLLRYNSHVVTLANLKFTIHNRDVP